MQSDGAASGVLTLMETGAAPESDSVDGSEAAYRALFAARFDEALLGARSAPPTPYGIAVRRQIEALCTGSVPADSNGRPDLDVSAYDPRTLEGAMAIFHTSEAAHVVGALDDCSRMLQSALSSGSVPPRARVWLQLGRSRSLLFQGEFSRAAQELDEIECGVAAPLVEESVQCVRAMAAGLLGDLPVALRCAEHIAIRVRHASSYADAGFALLGAYGLAACGLPQAASELLRLGAGGAGLPLLPRALRAYGYDMAVEAAIAAGERDLASWMILDLDRLDLGENRQLLSARETARARVRIAAGDAHAGATHAREATRAALECGSALVGARAALTASLAAADVSDILESVTGAELRAWLDRALRARDRDHVASGDAAWAGLTPAQSAVARLAARGLRNHEIAGMLVLSTRTVEAHIAAVLDALGVRTRVGIVTAARSGHRIDERVVARLTPRQLDVALGMLDGLTNAQIGERLGVSLKAIERHVTALFAALGVQSRAAVVAALLGDATPRETTS